VAVEVVAGGLEVDVGRVQVRNQQIERLGLS